jgi:hypothetical protein
MGSKTSKANKEFQAVIPYTPSSRPNPKRKKNATQPRRPTVAPALTKENSGISVDSDDQEQAKPPANKRIPLRSPSICEDVGWVPMSSNFDFSNTEGQNRRDLIASCSEECSMITSFLFVGGSKVANSKEILNQQNITRIINCSLCAVDNVFESDGSFTYLSLNMLDGRQDDISWFVGEVINFIELSRKDKCNVLLHCEKGISRSCSFAIAYVMWASGERTSHHAHFINHFDQHHSSLFRWLILSFFSVLQAASGKLHSIMSANEDQVVLPTQVSLAT